MNKFFVSRRVIFRKSCIRFLIYLFIVPVLVACGHNPPLENMYTINQKELDELKLAYYSDYFSFVGEDEQGKVSFAIDNNRGQDADTWQADHFTVLHDEKHGWQTLEGNGLYPNNSKQLKTIPDSSFFTFHGSPSAGIQIDSDINQLSLNIEPIVTRWKNQKGLSRFVLGSAEASLIWKGRLIKGRVIHEFLYLPAFNRLSRKYYGVFKDFHGLYAMTENGGDFYIHDQKSEALSPLVGETAGFLFSNGVVMMLDDSEVRVKNRDLTLGFYRWPTGWRGHKQYESSIKFDVDFSQKNTLANWVVGGFSMGIIRGEVIHMDKKIKIYGLGELIL